MLKMQNVILRSANEQLSLKYALTKLKYNYLKHTLSISQQAPNITNKALYLDYVEQVLKNKQQDLVQLDKKLSQRESQICDIQFKKGVGEMIVQMESIKVIEKKLKSIQDKMGIRDEEYMMLYRKFQSDCAKCKNQMEQAFKNQYADLMNERRILRTKISQFAQLQSYEKYLNQLHNALQIKSQQLAQKQSLLSQNQSQNYHNQFQFQNQNQNHQLNQNHQHNLQSSYSSQSKKFSQNTHTSNRKRIKIFNTKPHCPSQQSKQSNAVNLMNKFVNNNNHNHNHNTLGNVSSICKQQSARLYQNETFAKQGQCSNYNINESSAIMAENSKDDISDYNTQVNNHYNSVQRSEKQEKAKQKANNNIFFKQKILNSASKQFINQKQMEVHGNENEIKIDSDMQNSTNDFSVQVNSQTFDQAGQRLRKQALIIKYTKKWMKFCFDSNSNKNTINRKKAMAVNLWKMNACFDQNISQSALAKINCLQKLWKKQQKLLFNSKMFPYNQLSLKRKKYAQLMFDLQRKIYHRERIQHVLKSILTNKHRKQRLIFYLYFCKFIKNNFSYYPRQARRQKSKITKTNGTQDYHTNQMIYSSSSQVLNQQRINLPNRKSTASLSSNKSPTVLKQNSMKRLGNGNTKQNQDQQIKKNLKEQEKRMKQFIAQRQRTQKLLATQCVKLEGLIKICVILTEAIFRTNNYAMKKITQSQYNDKLNTLTSQINGLQFRYDLALTKCKLGLANNNNKLSTLQNLLQFTNLMK